MTSFRTILLACCLALSAAAGAQGLLGPTSNQDQFLPVDEAFRFSASADGGEQVALDWQIAPGYYLYRHRVSAKTATEGFVLAEVAMPAGKKKTDEFFGDVEVYYDALAATVPVTRPAGGSTFEIAVSYQGCADAGLCYPPVTKTVSIELPPPGTPPRSEAPVMVAEQDRLASLIADGSLLVVMATFLGFGLLLAFTPCVLPMIPILSGIIAGQGAAATPSRSFLLSLTYVLGMALTYTIAGAAFAAAGQQAQAFFQQPWIIILFAGLFVVLALAMFGLFDLKIPAALETRLAAVSGRQKAGSFIGTAIMGALSALVVTACVAPPMVAALAVIGQTGDVLRGALALFAMAIGMGAPLLLVGVAGGRFLPHAGPWMTTIKTLFGVLFLAVAVWMLERILPGPLALALWALLVIVGGYYFGGFGRTAQGDAALRLLARGAGLAAIVWGIIMMVGAAAGGHDPFQPLRGAALPGIGGGRPAASAEALPFVKVATVLELDRELAAAQAAGRPAMLDFYADWCVSCKEMEKYTFSVAEVQQDLSGFVLLKADVTANNEADQALLRRFGVYGPPTTAFFGAHGRECRPFRLVGYVAADDFRAHLARFAREC
ncbi:MAG TPA: protein-disulfide reductase DsbD [Steroidobacteraceae bacterium]|nr:protein-disulfide reductase DsbD [Steroidobacteraceae bacterium]